MIHVPVLLVGDATDGPVEEIVEIDSLEAGLKVFGGYKWTSSAVTSGATGATLSEAAFGNDVTVWTYASDGAVVPRVLHEFSASGTALTWTSQGDSATPDYNATALFKARAVPGDTSLLKGLYSALAAGGPVWCLRLGGVHASVTSGNWSFRAKYAGSRYNGTEISVSGGVVTVTPAPGTGRIRSFTPTTDTDFLNKLALDLSRGYISFRAYGPDSTQAFTLPDGTYTLASGTDGALTESSLQTFLSGVDLTGVDFLVPVGLSRVTALSGTVLETLQENSYPTVLVLKAGAGTLTATITGDANTQAQVLSVANDAVYDEGTQFERTDDATPLVAAVIGKQRYNATLLPLPITRLSPMWTEDEIHAITSAGHTVGYLSILKGMATWTAVTGDEEWPVSTWRAYQEIARILFSNLEPLLGRTILEARGVDAVLRSALAKTRGSIIENFSLETRGSTISASLDFRPHGEVRTVTASLALATRLPSL